MRRWLLVVWIGLLASVVWAQDSATNLPINYGDRVNGQISQQFFFDHWLLNTNAHDRIDVVMQGSDGLQPLIGILNANGDLLTRSDDGQANGSVELTYDVPTTGLYIIVATRVGNEKGTSSGSYSLLVDNTAPPPTRDPRFQDVTFPCGDFDATSAVTVQFAHEATDNGAYSLRVYGLDGFQPVIRVQSGSHDDCYTDPADALGDVITIPGQRPLTITQADLSATVQHVIGSDIADPNSISVTIGSAHGAPGRYFMAVGGFNIEPSTDRDNFNVRLAPYPAQGNAPLLFYVVGVNNRLDPGIITDTTQCDDAGRRGCEDVPSFAGAGVIFNNGVHVIGDRFDAGVKISDANAHNVQVSSFSGTTHGEYALILIGSLPPHTP